MLAEYYNVFPVWAVAHSAPFHDSPVMMWKQHGSAHDGFLEAPIRELSRAIPSPSWVFFPVTTYRFPDDKELADLERRTAEGIVMIPFSLKKASRSAISLSSSSRASG